MLKGEAKIRPKATRVFAVRQVMNVLLIGIAGGSGSGKSTLTEKIKERFGNDVTVILHDDYYKAHHNMTYEERALINYDEPDAYDTSLMVEDLRVLKEENRPITMPVYDYSIHDRSDAVRTVSPTKVIVVEGILVLSEKSLCDLFDIKVFVDTDADVRIIRRIGRDMKTRARTFDSVVSQYMNTVKPMHERYVEPSKKNADVIVPEGGRNPVVLDILFQKISNHIKGIS